MAVQSEETLHALSDPQQWVDLYGDALYRFALLKLRDPIRAEDVLQETFLAALKSKENYNGKAPVKNWLMGIMNHKIIDLFRKSGREKPVDDLQIHENDAFFDSRGFWLKGPATWKTDPSEAVSHDEFWRVLMQCLSALPEKTAQAFMLREIDQLDFQEICDALGISTSNYWVIMHRARLQLRACLGKNWFETMPGGAN